MLGFSFKQDICIVSPRSLLREVKWQAHDLTQELISIADSPGLQDRLGVILTTHGEILNRRGQLRTPDQTNPGDSHTALEKQQRAVKIFRQLEKTTSGPLREQTLRKLMESLISMADTLELLELMCKMFINNRKS